MHVKNQIPRCHNANKVRSQKRKSPQGQRRGVLVEPGPRVRGSLQVIRDWRAVGRHFLDLRTCDSNSDLRKPPLNEWNSR